MSQLGWHLLSMVLSLLSLPLLSIGTDTDTAVVWVVGLALVGVAGVVPPMLRYATPGEPDGDGGDGGGNGDGPGNGPGNGGGPGSGPGNGGDGGPGAATT